MLKPSLFAALMVLAPLALPAVAQDSTADTVVATVNGAPITLGQMIVMKEAAAQEPQMAGLPDDQLFGMILDQLIQQSAVAAAGTETPAVRARLELQRRSALASAALEKIASAEPTEDEIKSAYDTMFASAGPVTEYSAAHILVDSEEKAKAIKAELDGGADFGTVAEANSTGPSGPNKGDLGWFSADQMVKPFADAVAGMEKGQVSDPVQTEFGWHVIRLNDTRVRNAPPLDEVRDQVTQTVLRNRVQSEIQRLTGEAKVEKVEGIDPALIGRDDLLEAQ